MKGLGLVGCKKLDESQVAEGFRKMSNLVNLNISHTCLTGKCLEGAAFIPCVKEIMSIACPELNLIYFVTIFGDTKQEVTITLTSRFRKYDEIITMMRPFLPHCKLI